VSEFSRYEIGRLLCGERKQTRVADDHLPIMEKRPLDWNDLRYFLGVARSGSLTQAASDLRVSQSTVSRRISELEESVGMPLFARHQTGYFLTDEGREVLKHAEIVEDSIMALERGTAGRDKSLRAPSAWQPRSSDH
jgi:molybdenum-dependent DNA-binding transcriptional regulator ModE